MTSELPETDERSEKPGALMALPSRRASEIHRAALARHGFYGAAREAEQESVQLFSS
ncbi:hypothetical protein [Pelagibacterium lentulum]|uniref:hypothetical protein n=1 Tax=Pelagibacterium lentulum TaxID=2029865 RepID=UPI00166648DC|nr:hypothetical protein [Pelagibacterium lentulum]